MFTLSQSIYIEKNFDELRKTFIEFEIRFLNIENKQVDKKNVDEIVNDNMSKITHYSSVKIDLLSLAIGPQYYDIMLYENGSETNEKGRLSFKIIAHQINTIEINSDSLTIELYKTNTSITKFSDKLVIKTNDDNVWKLNKNMPQKKRIMLTKSFEDETKVQYKPDDLESVSFSQQLALNQLHSSNMFPFIYLQNPENSELFEIKGYYGIKVVEMLSELFSKIEKQTSKLFNLLLINSEKSNTLETIDYLTADSFETVLSSNIVRFDQFIGKISSNFCIKNVPLMKQFPCGIFTEEGLAINSYSLYSYLQCPKNSFAAFSNIHTQLANLYENLRKKIDAQKASNKNKEYRMTCELTEIRHLFDESISDNFLCYQYDKFEDMQTAQELFLLIGNAMYELINNLSVDDIMTAFDIIKLICEREEFEQTVLSESWVTYNEKENTYVFKETVIKKGLVELLMKFNMSSLKFSKFSDESPEDEENKKIPQSRLYLNILMSYNFFKFPQARNSILDSLYSDVPNKNLSYIPYDKEAIDLYPESKVLYWDLFIAGKFECAIKNLKESNENVKELVLIMKERKSKPVPFPELNINHAFGFDLIKNIIQLTIKKLGKDHGDINWLSISAFPEIINLIIYELSNKEISEYPNNLQDVLVLFVNDPLIINKFLSVIISKANAYDTNAVYYVIGFLDNLFMENKKRSPYEFDFDYTLILKAFTIVSQIDNCLAISKMLWLYYKDAHLMPSFHLMEMTKKIFEVNFYKFFFHWSWKVRKMWYTLLKYILLYRLNDKIKLCDFQFKQNENCNKTFSDYFHDKMEVIRKIRFRTQSKGGVFELNDDNKKLIEPYVDKENWNNIENGIKEYLDVEKEFNEWKVKKEKNKNVDYPIMIISPLKDDVDF